MLDMNPQFMFIVSSLYIYIISWTGIKREWRTYDPRYVKITFI